MLTALLLATGLTAGISGCAQASTKSAGSTSTAASDLERIASGNKSPSSSGSARAFSPSSASASGEPFVVPEAAKAHTKGGAIAFVRFYWNMLGQLDAHPQIGVIPKFAAEGCKACQQQEASGAQLLKEHSRVVAKTSEISSMSVRPDPTADSVVVLYREVLTGSKKIAPRGSANLPNVDQRSAARADWSGDRWVMGEVGTE